MSEQVTTEKLFADLQAVVRDAEALLKATSGQAGEKFQGIRAKAEDSVRQARQKLASLEEGAVLDAKEMVESAESFVREKPWQAVGIAAGVGLLVGLLMSRR
ncbi:MAG: DUF883 family protein [Candidatus Obscuribacterales bacterium]|nr:DUF883 family protein [Steroidobacteraceae bacterium]